MDIFMILKIGLGAATVLVGVLEAKNNRKEDIERMNNEFHRSLNDKVHEIISDLENNVDDDKK